MKILRIIFLTALFMVLTAGAAFAKVTIFCYHELDHANDNFAVTSKAFEEQIKYLQGDGYHFVSLDEYIRYTKGELELPEKSVMLTFDDGYRSFYTTAYPLLQKYRVPAMLAIVTSWTDGEGTPSDVRAIASWDELREMEQSGLVTVVSHTHAMHKQQAITPQGDRNGVAGYHLYVNRRYESNEEYVARITADLERTQELFVEKLGHPSRAIVWPYGIYSQQSLDAAMQSGAEASFRLDGGAVTEPGEKSRLYAKRIIMSSDVTLNNFKSMLANHTGEWNEGGVRLSQVDIDNIYDTDPVKFDRNIATVVNQLQQNSINIVALQAFADPDGDGEVDKVYFPNSVVPVEADVLSHVANTFMQNGLVVAAWMPTLNYQPLIAADRSNAVRSSRERGWYRRVSPFDNEAMAKVETMYRELATYTPVGGILFQDDLYLNDFEDVSEPATRAYRNVFGGELSALDHNDKAAMQQWTQFKTGKLTSLSQQMADAFREVHPEAIIMRDIYTGPVTEPQSTEWFAQNYADFLQNYDYTVVMAYPYMDQADDPIDYLKNIAAAVKAADGADKSIIKIQSYDWENERWIGADNFKTQLTALDKEGMSNLGYYPNTFYEWMRKSVK